MISFTLAIQSHNYQKRLSCMLSSLYEQQDKDKYELVVDIAYLKNAKNNPTSENVIEHLSALGLKIKARPYDSLEVLQFRGVTRNHQIADCKTDFMLFSDTDMAYHPYFFSKMANTLQNDEKYNKYDGVMTCGRFSQEDIAKTNSFVDSVTQNGNIIYVKDIWNKADKQLEKVARSNVGAGFYQLINMKLCAHGGYYVDEKSNKDHAWIGHWHKTKSDQQFRRRIGKKMRMPEWFSNNQIHFTHNRDNMTYIHLEEQR